MSDFAVSLIVVALATMAIFDFVVLRWLRRRANRKFTLQATDLHEPPCWPYGWPDQQ